MPLFPDFERTYPDAVAPGGSVRWFPFRSGAVLVRTAGDAVSLLTDADATSAPFPPVEPIFLGRLAGISYAAFEVPEEIPLPDGMAAIELRKLYGRLDAWEWEAAGYASQILHWRRTSRFCPLCGSATEPMGVEWMRRCSACGHERYPQISPAVLVLVHDGGDGILLAHKPGWGDRYSILAGFVLPGESLEECAQREVLEEVGVQITNITYAGSQPWPYPHQLMIGFTARYTAGTIRLDEHELDRAAWFDVHSLPELPAPLSLSRQIIETWRRARTERNAGADEH